MDKIFEAVQSFLEQVEGTENSDKLNECFMVSTSPSATCVHTDTVHVVVQKLVTSTCMYNFFAPLC